MVSREFRCMNLIILNVDDSRAKKKKSSDDGIKDKRDDNNSPPVHLPSLHSSKKESRLMH